MESGKRKLATRDFFEHAAELLGQDGMRRAEAKAKNILLSIRLAELRQQEGRSQSEVPGFSQTSVSRLESRGDIRLSTLQDYLDGLDYDVEVVARPRRRGKPKVVLLGKE